MTTTDPTTTPPNVWLRPVDHFVPEAIRAAGGVRCTRARLLAAACLVGAVLLLVGGALTAFWLSLSTGLALSNLVGGVALLLSAQLLRMTGAVRAVAHLVLALGWGMTVLNWVASAGGALGALYSLPIIPLFATLLGGRTAGLAWTGVCAATAAVLVLTPTGERAVTGFVVENLQLQLVRDVVMLTIWTAMVSLLYDTVHTRAQRDAERARARAEESEERFAQAFQANPEGIVIADSADGRVLECNEGFLTLLGLAREQTLGLRDWREALGMSPAQRQIVHKVIDELGRLDEIAIERADAGGTRSLRVQARRVELGGRPSVLATVRDVTEQTRLEAQLLQAQKMEAVGQLAGAIAHDFNNMLTVISGYAEQLGDQLSGEPREMADEVHKAAARSADLTRQLLAFSRRQVLKPQVLDLNEMVRRLEKLLERLLGETVSVELDLAVELGLVRADLGQIEQVIVNLAINGRDAMPEGGRLLVTTANVEAPEGRTGEAGGWVCLGVQDTGVGMEDATLDRAFEPFFTTKEPGRGTGLGLSTVHGIVSQSGGEIAIQSRPGRGTTVRVFLPRVEGETASTSETPRRTENAATTRHTVLLVEDDPMVRRLTRRTLWAAGYDVIEAADGDEALERFHQERERIDLVLTDVVMPRRGGPALAHALTELGATMPVIFMSGYPNPREEHGPELPEDAVLIHKPFGPAALCERIARTLGSVTSKTRSHS